MYSGMVSWSHTRALRPLDIHRDGTPPHYHVHHPHRPHYPRHPFHPHHTTTTTTTTTTAATTTTTTTTTTTAATPRPSGADVVDMVDERKAIAAAPQRRQGWLPSDPHSRRTHGVQIIINFIFIMGFASHVGGEGCVAMELERGGGQGLLSLIPQPAMPPHICACARGLLPVCCRALGSCSAHACGFYVWVPLAPRSAAVNTAPS